MKKLFLIIFVFSLISFTNSFAGSIKVSGSIPVNTIWSADTVIVTGYLTIEDSAKLMIKPGTIVILDGYFPIVVKGCLKAEGTRSDSIFFKAADNEKGWPGIIITNYDYKMNDNDSSKFFFCRVENVKSTYMGYDCGTITVSYFSKVIISDCKFINNSPTRGGGVKLDHADISILNSCFTGNTSELGGYAIYCMSSNPYICGNIISNNRSLTSGINISSSYPVLINNLIVNNTGTAIYFSYTSAKVINCTICNNNTDTVKYGAPGSGGVTRSAVVISGSSPSFSNTLIFGNGILGSENSLAYDTIRGKQVFIWDDNSTRPVFKNCAIQGGIEEFGGEGADYYRINYKSNYLNNIFPFDPFLKNPTKGQGPYYNTVPSDWTLKDISPYINRGTTDTSGLKLPKYDFAGNARVADGRIDIGAFEFKGAPAQNALIYVYPTNVSFLDTKAGKTSAEKQAKISNAGHGDLLISTITAPQGFEIRTDKNTSFLPVISNVTLKPWTDTTLYVIFKPDEEKEFAGNIGFQSSDTINTDCHISATGKGTSYWEYSGELNITTIWSDTVHVTGNVTANETLTIVPGTYIEMQGDYSISINKKLSAAGKSDSMIVFTPKDKATGWQGIKISPSVQIQDTSRIDYCAVEYAAGKGTAAQYNGGAIYLKNAAKVVISNSIIRNNSGYTGSGIYSDKSSPEIIKNKFLNNKSVGNGGAIFSNADAQFENNIFDGNEAKFGAGLYCSGNKVLIFNNKFINNKAVTAGGGLFLTDFYGKVINNEFYNNRSAGTGGGIQVDYVFKMNKPSPFISGNVICNNTASYAGGGISILNGPNPIVSNNTICSNFAGERAGGVECYSAGRFYNTIIWGNKSGKQGDQVGILFMDKKISVEFNNCDIEGGHQKFSLYASLKQNDTLYYEKNIDFDPGFSSPSLGTGADFVSSDSAWTLKQNSLCINGGYPDTTGLSVYGYDIMGNKRLFHRIDIGAYEFQGEPVPIPIVKCVPKTYLTFELTGTNKISAPEFFKLKNAGTGDLTIQSVKLTENFQAKLQSDSSYSETLNKFIIGPGRDTLVSVIFKPVSAGKYSGKVDILCDDSLQQSISLGLSGSSENTVVRGVITQDAVWKATVYVDAPLTIANNVKIKIDPGTRIIFNGINHPFNVKGTITAIGTKADSIFFIPARTDSGWYGISFDNTDKTMKSSDTSKFAFCRFGSANNYAIYIKKYSGVVISDCSFINEMVEGAGSIYCTDSANVLISGNYFKTKLKQFNSIVSSIYSNPVISNNRFNNNILNYVNGFISCSYSSPVITGNSFINNRINNSGCIINAGSNSSLILTNNLIYNNKVSAWGVIDLLSRSVIRMVNNIIAANSNNFKNIIYMEAGSFIDFINNTITDNKPASYNGFIECRDKSSFSAVNNIFYNNSRPDEKQKIVSYEKINPKISNCDIQGGLSCLLINTGYEPGYDTTLFRNNIDVNPLFSTDTDTSAGLWKSWSLSPGSLCINSGSPDTSGLYLPLTDYSGGLRISGGRIDMGALEYQFISAVKKDHKLPVKYDLLQNYPNPFNPATVIHYSVLKESSVRLSVYNSIGAHVADLVDKRLPAGEYEELFNAKSLASGIYYYTILIQSADGKDMYRSVKKMILLK